MRRSMPCAAIALCAGLAAAGCDQAGVPKATKTEMPGMVAAGGHTSGEVMAATRRPETTSNPPAGTPGIPAGAEGNVGGTAPGAVAHAAVAAGTAPASAPAAGASAPALTAAQREAQELAASMNAIAAHWRERAGQNGWPMNPPTPIQAAPAIAAQASPQAAQAPATAASMPIRSQKLGTAPASPDVKTGQNVHPPGVGADAPNKAGR